MLEKLLKELGKQGYEVSWQHNVTSGTIDICLKKLSFNKCSGFYKTVTFDELGYISEGQPGLEFAMTQILRWMVDEMEEEMRGEDNENR